MSPAVDRFAIALHEHLDALDARDAERFARTVSRPGPVCVVGPRGVVTEGFAHILDAHRAWFAEPERWSFQWREVWRRSGEDFGVALLDVTYRNVADEAPVRFMLSLVFAREDDGEWRLIYDQNTPLG